MPLWLSVGSHLDLVRFFEMVRVSIFAIVVIFQAHSFHFYCVITWRFIIVTPKTSVWDTVSYEKDFKKVNCDYTCLMVCLGRLERNLILLTIII